MIVFASLIYIVYFFTNFNAFVILNKKKDSFDDTKQKRNTNYLFIRWLILIGINGVFIILLLVLNMFYNVQGSQNLIDNLATIGFALILVLCVLIYMYILRFRKLLNVTHSLGFIAIYAVQYSLITIMIIYFAISSI